MYEISCDMCMDLMPLVKDGVASPDSVASVEWHIAGCDSCRELYEGKILPQADGERALSNAIRRVKKISGAVLALFVLMGICLSERILQGSSVVFLVMVLLIWRLGRTAVVKGTGPIQRVAALLFAAALTAGLCTMGNAFLGNPLSRMLAERAAENYLAGKFPEGGYEVENVWFDSKRGHYGIVVHKSGSQDVRFTVDTDMEGNFHHDTYDDVLTGWNTANRLGTEYEILVEPVLHRLNLTYSRAYVSGSLEFEHRKWKDDPYAFQYFLNGEALVPDGAYDIEAVGEAIGKLSVAVEDADVSAEKVAQILLEIRRLMDEAGVPFHFVDLTLRYPRPENAMEPGKEGQIRIEGFMYEDIYADELVERVTEAELAGENA